MSDYHYVACALCRSSESRFLYKFNYRKFGLKQPFILVQCTRCGHSYNNPRLKTNSLNRLYNKNYYMINQEYLNKRAWELPLRDYLDKIMPWEKKISGRNLLDIGCGLGFLLKICRDNGWQVYGVDVSEAAVEYAKKSFGLNIELGRIEDIDFKGKRFNLILALDLLEHLENPAEFINCCYGLLEENGILVIETPNIASIYRKITGRFWVGFNPYHIQLFSSATLRRLISASNFQILGIYTAFNDIFAKRNLWRWFSNPPFLKTLFNGLWQLKNRIFSLGVHLDITKIDANCRNLENKINLNKLREKHHNIFARYFLGDQLIVFLAKK